MSNTQLIRNKILSTINTQKITRTMEMISISKRRKFQKKLLVYDPYMQVLKNMVFNILHGSLKHTHFILQNRKCIKKIGMILIFSNQGLCGGLNNNVFKKAIFMINKYFKKNILCDIYILGAKGFMLFNNTNIHCIKEKIKYQDGIQDDEFFCLVNSLLNSYQLSEIDKLIIISNQFKKSLSKDASIFQLLPIDISFFQKRNYKLYSHWDYLYEPDSNIVIDAILKKYVLFQIFQSVLENIVCEQSYRMITMKIASDNSENIIQELRLLYNKMRQFNITQELIEIISGNVVT